MVVHYLPKFATDFYDWMLSKGDPRVQDWPLMATPGPILTIFFLYIVTVRQGPKLMESQKPIDISKILVVYNMGLVVLSAYMCYEFVMSAALAGYSFICQPVDYSTEPLALRMANVCWWYFFSKVIELVDTIFLILRKNDISFLHAYHHSSMLINWWLGVKYVAGGQAFFMGVLNTFVHIIMYSYYGLSALGPSVQKHLWWKKYVTKLQLIWEVLETAQKEKLATPFKCRGRPERDGGKGLTGSFRFNGSLRQYFS